MTTGCEHDHESPGLHGRALQSELSVAEARCAQDDQRLTPPRRRVLELLLQHGQPMKAYDLIAGFSAGGPPAKPPTVYRALEFLEKQGFAHRIESLNAYVACKRGPQSHAAAFLICDCCGRSSEVEPVGADALTSLAEASGYLIDHVTIEAHGRCDACRH
jgi:Fur family zinc uptake transcriptional regulator